jgi:hypothetical protein
MAEDRFIRRLAKQARRFAEAHGGATAAVEYLGARGTRIVLVGGDGFWGDLVVPGQEAAAERVVEAAGLARKEDFGGDVRTGPYEWGRMAGMQLGGRA